ncbi:MAG: Crp/Fnr family transcriptional regulator [Flavobacterium sp.]|uniref:Crp/Fnr family transcriptional regulator n=1 Tax=Flavobacterium sp. TaxID=239 RepID=UPI0025C1CF23|nr:Crp/Fnr family transcriptional regulator [Flavobacterium sp.]MCA1967380.1 Crp/Fnr family transcriptional regulator [Flavobacterium sp.]
MKKFQKSKKSEIIELPYSERDRIFFLKKGILKLIRITEDGEEVLQDIIQKGDLFGEIGFEKNSTESEFMKVVSEEAILCMFYRDRLEEIMLQKPDFALTYIKFIGFQFTKIKNSYKNILFKDAKTRLILLFITLIESEKINQGEFIIPKYLTQKDMAQLICTTRQTVISLLNELQKEKFILNENNKLIINDIEKFKKLVESVK